MSKHQKHKNLLKPDLGQFGRNEISILGTNCGEISKLTQKIISRLPQYKLTYVDADHQVDQESQAVTNANLLTNKISHFQWDVRNDFNEYEQKILLNNQDLVLINGNHFKGKKQIIVLDEKKEASLKKRLKNITNPLLLLRKDKDFYPGFIKELNIDESKILNLENIDSIVNHIKIELENSLPEVYGLVLAGGMSTRMGKDKGKILKDGQFMRDSMYEKLNSVCTKAFYSIRADQEFEFENKLTIIDKFDGLGPFGGILSAFQKHPNKTWFVVATDLPNVDEDVLKFLLEKRNPSKHGTAFNNAITKFPDPLCTIWEPKSHLSLLQFLYLGYSCPRKVLINSDVEIIEPLDNSWLFNMNTPEDLKSL